MEELLRWKDHEPTLRRFQINFDGTRDLPWSVFVFTTEDECEGRGNSLTFAAVRALIEWDKQSEA